MFEGKRRRISGPGVWTRWCFAGRPGSTDGCECRVQSSTHELPEDRSLGFGEPLLFMDTSLQTNRLFLKNISINKTLNIFEQKQHLTAFQEH